MRVIGMIPAAGRAVRLQPLPCSKEVYPVQGRPVIDHLVERMRLGGAEELRVVTRPEKRDVIARASELGARTILARTETVSESIAAGLEGIEPDTVVLLGFPDTIWEPVDGFRRLVDRFEPGVDVVLGLFRTPDLERSDVARFDASGAVSGIEVKPAVPPSEWIWGCAAARRSALDGIEGIEEPGSRFDTLASQGRVAGVELSDEWLDIGTREALAQVAANVER